MRRPALLHRLLAAAQVLLLLVPLALIPGAPLSVAPPTAGAQITNGVAGTRPVASIVDCIRSASDRGLPAGDSPRFVSTCFASLWDYRDYKDPANTGTTNGNASRYETALIAFGDTKEADGTDGPNEFKGSPIATVGDVGAVYGLAFSSGENPAATNGGATRRIFAAAYLKRATRFGDGGPGAIYVRNSTSPPTVGPYVYVPDAVRGPNGAPYDYSGPDADGYQPATLPNGATPAVSSIYIAGVHNLYDDATAVGWVSKQGLGDMDIDPDERFLYVVNLNNKRVYRFDTWSANPQGTVTVLPYIVPALAPCSTRGGTTNYRPFALAVTRDYLYLGAVCSAETSGDRTMLGARVDRIPLYANGTWGAWESVVGMHLPNYDGQRRYGTSRRMEWEPWVNSTQCNYNTSGSAFYLCPQPLLTDIEFDEQNNMLLGFRDRFGDVTGNPPLQQSIPSGDIIRAAWTGSGWAAPSTAADGEVFNDYRTVPFEGDKTEVSSGALAYIPGNQNGNYGGQVLTTWLDPHSGTSFGTAWFDARTGGNPTALQVLYAGGTELRFFGKAAGLGDIELLCNWAAVGDRVWNDTNANGVQDAGEGGVNGARVQLFASTDTTYATPLATVATGDMDGDGVGGEYRFYVNPWRSYVVRLDPTQFAAGGSFASWYVTRRNAGGNDTTDSDADDILRTIPIAAQGDGEVNITYDFGITSVAGTGQIGNQVWNDANGNGVQDAGEVGVAGVPVDLWACTDASRLSCPSGVSYAKSLSTTTSATGTYYFTSLPPNYYVVRFDTIPPGYNLSPANQGGNDALDSDVAAGTTWTPITTVTNGAINTTLDLGLVVSVGDIRTTLTGTASTLQGTTASYTVTAIGGTASAQNVTLSIPLPASAGVPTVTSVSAAGAASATTSGITWNVGTLAANATVTYNFTVTYGSLGSRTLTATIASSPVDSNTANNTASTATLVTSPNIAVTLTAPTTVAPGEQFTYQIAASNQSVQRGGTVPAASMVAATGTTLVATLPAGVTYLGFTGGSGTLTGNTLNASGQRILTWSLGSLASGGSQTITVQAQVQTTTPYPTTLPASASISSSPTTTADATSDNTDAKTTAVRYPDLAVGITAPAQTGEGSSMSYTVTYRNEGNEQALSTSLVVTLPAAVTLTPGGVSNGSYVLSNGGRTLTWSLGTLGAGVTGTAITIPVTVNTGASTSSPLVAQAGISSTTPEIDLTDNTASASTTVVPPPPAPTGSNSGMQIAIHSDLDPKSSNSLPSDAVYRSTGAEITWPAGEVLDFTPRARITLPAMTATEAQYYEYQARITGWSIVSFGADSKTASASGAATADRDALGRTGCRQGATTQTGLDGCAYPYIGGQDATQALDLQTMPTETQMASQAHVFWSPQRVASMRSNVYAYRVSGLVRTALTVQVLVEVNVISREQPGTVLDTRTTAHAQTYTVRLVAPRSAK